MRNIIKLSAVLLLASAGVASAQQAPTKNSGATVNWGYRGNSTDGDEARAERYRDLRAGPIGGASYFSETGKAALTFDAFNVGYNDQSYSLNYNQFGKIKFSALWNSIPLNYAYNTLTPWVTAGNNVWTLDQATRLAVQNKTNPAGTVGIGSTAAQFDLPSVYRSIAKPFEMTARRDIIDLGLQAQLTKSFMFDVGFNSAHRSGNQPWGAAFAFNNANELPLQIDDRNTDIKAGIEWSNAAQGMLRLQFVNSNFKNEFSSLTWDSPLRATDFDNGKTPPNGPYDASGYSNGNGPATGRMALNPSSKMNQFTVVGLKKLPSRSTLNGQIGYTKMTQDEALLPWTTNTKIANSAVYALFPKLASLPRATSQAEVEQISAALNFTTRPTDYLSFDVRYRYFDRENNTPEFDASNNVRFDAVPEAVPGTSTVHYNLRRNTFETGANITVVPNSTLRLSYGVDGVAREHRVFGNMTDYTFKATFDTYKSDLLTMRLGYEKTDRLGSGFSEEFIEESGSQPGTAFYDEADMTRNKGTFAMTLNPNDKFDIGFNFATGKDEYNGEEHKFGLMDNQNTSYGVNVGFYPLKTVAVSANYGYEKFSALQKARNANPLSGVVGAYESWNDANRDWSLDNDEKVTTIGADLDLLQAVKNTDIKFSYSLNKSDNAFVFSGPRIQEFIENRAFTTGDGSPCGTLAPGWTNCFQQFDPVTQNWQEFGVILSRTFGKKFGVNLGYNYEKFEVKDFATTNLADGSPRIDPLGAITTGYGNRPYTANVFTVKFNYNFQSAPILF